MTALHWAARYGHSEVVQSFVRVVALSFPSESRSCEEYEDAGHMQKADASEVLGGGDLTLWAVHERGKMMANGLWMVLRTALKTLQRGTRAVE